MRASKLFALTFLAALLAACGTTPDIPDQAQALSYRSTQQDAPRLGARDGATGEQLADKPADEMPKDHVPKASGPVATVNGEEISADDFNKEIGKIVASGAVSPRVLGTITEKLVDRMIDRKLVDQAIAKAGVTITEADIDAKLKEVRDEYLRAQQAMGGAGTFEEMLAKMGVSDRELRESIAQAIGIERLLKMRGLKTPTAEEVRAFYDANPEMFEQPEQVRARHILIKVESDEDKEWAEAKKKIEGVRKRLTAKGADFAAIARETSDDLGSRERGGDLGYFGKGQMVPEFEKAAFALKKDEISAPVRSSFGWHVIQQLDYKAEGTMKFEEVSEQLTKRLEAQRTQEALVALLEELREQAQIDKKLDNIK
jgi:parvulin-like peptidyl-prolyl isomerase